MFSDVPCSPALQGRWGSGGRVEVATGACAVDLSAYFLLFLPWGAPAPRPPALFCGAPAPQTSRVGLPPPKLLVWGGVKNN